MIVRTLLIVTLFDSLGDVAMDISSILQEFNFRKDDIVDFQLTYFY